MNEKKKAFIIESPCGRVYRLPFKAVQRDCAKDKVQYYKISMAKAMKQTDDEAIIRTWFHEQFNWQDVARLGTIIRQPTPAQIKIALDKVQADGSDPGYEYTEATFE